MGLVHYGIHKEIALAMRDKHGLTTFVETGTWKGDSAEWAATRFKHIFTIEVIEEYYKESKERLSQFENVQCYHADSREFIRMLAYRIPEPTLLWLDSHWTGHPDFKPEYGKDNALTEINVINEMFRHPHVIMVDDYSLFPRVTGTEKEVIIEALLNEGKRRVIIEDDIFYAEPKE